MQVLFIGGSQRSAGYDGSPGPDVTIVAHERSGLVTEAGVLTPSGQDLVQDAGRADLVLMAWDFEAAPVINAITHALRMALAGPSVILCAESEAPEALAAGADAVVHPPVTSDLLGALAFAHRRLLQVTSTAVARGIQPAWPVPPAASAAGLAIDPATHSATYGERDLRLTAREAALLAYLVRHAGRVCTREELLDRVWGIRFETGTNMVDVYVHFVRRRLAALGCPHAVSTVRGVGYRLDTDEGPVRTTTSEPSDNAR